MTEWGGDFEAIAKGDAMAMVDNAPPLERGQYVAWTIQGDFGCTQELSAKHIAGTNSVTLCGQIIPPPRRRLAVAYKSLKVCIECSLKYARLNGGLGS